MHGEVGDAVAAAVDVLGAVAEVDVPLGPMTTYRVGGAAAVLVRARSHADLVRVAAASRSSGLPVLPVGRGSNMLVADEGFRGIAVCTVDLPERLDVDESTSVVTASAGVSLPVLARRTAAAGLTGFEWAVGVPGSLGGAIRMNAGGHGSDIAASLIDATVIDMADDDIAADDIADDDIATDGSVVLTADELGLAFRSSSLPPSCVVVEGRLQLSPGDRAASEREISEIVAWRRANQPGGQNAGSVFVNPVPGELSAGQLIDELGLRGLRVGSAQVSEKHANFIQADEGGTAADVRALMRLVRDRVEASTGWSLRSEIRLIGFGEQ